MMVTPICQYCGFRGKQHLEVVNLRGNYRNNWLKNLATACSFCAQRFFLELIGKDELGAVVMPRKLAIFIAVSNFVLKRWRNNLGEGLSNPGLFGQLLVDSQMANIAPFQ